jgi:hypothetical protein
MQGHATRHIAFVVLLLCVACVGVWHAGTAYAAPQRARVAKVYLPIVHLHVPAATRDLQIIHMGLYQSVQNPSNGVTLIADKPAILRVYAQASAADSPAPVASVTIEARRAGRPIGSRTVGPQAVSTAPTADDMTTTFNFDLPMEWLKGQVELTATIDKKSNVAESNESNNTRTGTFTFHEVPALDLTIVPITYVDTQTGITFSEPGHDPISEWLLSAFPVSEVNVAIHAPFTFTGNLRQADEWVRLLNELSALWAAEVGAGSGQVYYGLVPNSAPGGGSWFSGGVSGLGWIGQRVSAGVNVGPETGEAAGHEIGHNFGRYHAPCGNPSGIDPHFPYPNASIGVYGVDTTDETLLDPELTHDMMSYCGPEWVSDYTYEGLLQDQFQRGGRAGAKGEGLLLRATVEGETITALPIYRLDTPLLPTEANAEYQVQLLDDGGAVLATYPAVLFEIEETDVSARMIMAHVPALTGDRQLGKVRFLKDSEVVAERGVASPSVDRAASLTPTVSSTANKIVLDWGATATPALVRFSPDGQTWTVIVFDVTGGRLEIERDSLPSAEGLFEIVPADGGVAAQIELK